MPVPYAFSAATSAIPLSQLDANFNTTITLGNTAIQLGNTVTTLNNMTLANVTISSGNVTITNVTVTTANVTTVNATTVIATTANVTTGNVTNLVSGNVSITGGSITGTPISGSTGSFTTLTTSSTVTLNGGTAGGVAYLDGSKVLTTGSALAFDGDSFVVGGIGNFGRINAQRFASSPQATITIGDNTTLSNDVGIYFRQTSGVSGFSTAGSAFAWYNGGPGASEQMRLTSTGLGIGTSSPGTTLDVYKATGNSIIRAFAASGIPRFDLRSATRYYSVSIQSDNLTFFDETAGSTRMTLDSSGNLGIGTSSPSVKLDVVGAGVFKLDGFGTTTPLILRNNNTASVQVVKIGFDSNGAIKASINAAVYGNDYMTFNVGSDTERMRLDSSGNLGIGTSSPGYKLDVNLASGTALARFTGPEYAQVVHTDGIRSLFTQVFDNQARLFTESSTPLVFGTNNTERARIDSSGDLLVGTTSSGATNARLRAVQASGSNSAFEATANDAAYAGTLVYNTTTRAASSSFDFDGFYANGVGQFRVSGNGVIYAQNTTVQSISDVRLKENIKDATDGLSVVSALRPVRYDWKTGFGNDGKNQLGFIAQEVEKVFPEAISEWKVNREDETVYKTVGPGSFIPVLVKAIQELKAEVDSLKSQLEGK